MQLTLFNPEVFFEESDTIDIDFSETNVRFSLTMDATAAALVRNNSMINTLCFQLNGLDCHCFPNISDISAFAFRVPTSCKVSRSDESQVLFSIKLSVHNRRKIVSAPVVLVAGQRPANVLTLVLLLTLDDLSRASLLALTLRSISSGSIYELVVITPDEQSQIIHLAFASLLQGAMPVRVIPESKLFMNPAAFLDTKAHSYAIQMALKLLVSRALKTAFYITLDADVLLLKPARIQEAVRISSREVQGFDESSMLYFNTTAGIYEDEPRGVHAEWWTGAARFLDLPADENVLNSEAGAGFSVTPAVLSTLGSRLVLQEIVEAQWRCHGDPLDQGRAELSWIESLGTPSPLCTGTTAQLQPNAIVIWSEYTLYRLALDNLKIFPYLHVPQITLSLHCHDVWYAESLPWDAAAALRDSCLFSVVQSSTGISPSKVLAQLRQHALISDMDSI